MSVQVKKHTRSSSRRRRSHLHLKKKTLGICAHCGKNKLPHNLCANCQKY